MTEEKQKEDVEDGEEVKEDTGPTPYEIACYKYNTIVSRYHGVTKLIRDAVQYKKTFEINESWGPEREMYEWFKGDAELYMTEIWSDMKKMREDILTLRAERNKLKERERRDD